ncbi:MAG: hypothetical protein HY078_13405 [Elusimicrobia bacterium]|nr:hypothetical protein [Elusimicrobiota bacterium]
MRPIAAWMLLSAAVPAWAGPGPWATSVGYDDRGARADVSFRVRWDRRDALRLPLEGGKALLDPFGTVASVVGGALGSPRLQLYGVVFRPVRRGAPASASKGAGASSASSAAPTEEPGIALSLAPSLDSLTGDAKRELRRWMVRETFDHSLRNHRDAPYWQKQALVDAAAGTLGNPF